MRWVVGIWLVLAGVCCGHGTSTATVRLWEEMGRIVGAWEVALGDLELLLGVDGNGDGEVSWEEMREREGLVGERLAGWLKFSSGGERVGMEVGRIGGTKRWLDEVIVVVPFRLDAGVGLEGLGIEYGALFDLDAGHRGLLVMGEGEDLPVVFRFSPGSRRWRSGG